MSPKGKEKVVEPSSGEGRSPCAACQHLERACGPECVFAPHFPAGDGPATARFASVHAAFGADNVARFLGWVHPERRAEAVHWLARNTLWRLAIAPAQQPSAAAASSEGGTPPPCAACQYLQITCVPGCVFAPHIPAGEDLARFAALHACFGASDIALILCGLSPEKQVEAMGTLVHLAQQPTADAGAGSSASPPPPPRPVERRIPCTACKYFRQKCEANCTFRPYYPPDDDPKRFSAVHELFGASTLARQLRQVPPDLRVEATKWTTYEARRRQQDPVHGVTSDILILDTLLKMLKEQLAATRRELARYIGVEAVSRSFVPAHKPQSQSRMMPGVTEQILEDGVRDAAQQVMPQVKADAAAGVTKFVTPLHEKWVKDMTPGSSTGATAVVPGSSAQSSTDIHMEEQPSQAPTATAGLTAVVTVPAETAATIHMQQAPAEAAGVQDPGLPEGQDAGDEPSPDIHMQQQPSEAQTAAAGVQDPGHPEGEDAGDQSSRDASLNSFLKHVTIIKFMEKVLNTDYAARPSSGRNIVKKAVRGLKIKGSHQKDKISRYKITGISPNTVSQTILTGAKLTSTPRTICNHPQETEKSIGEMVLHNKYTVIDQANIPFVSDVSTTVFGDDIIPHSSGEASAASIVTVFVCIYDKRIPISVNLRKNTVAQVVRVALLKEKIRVKDAYLYLEGRVLDGNQTLASLSIGRDSHIYLGPRTRGGVPFGIYRIFICHTLQTVLLNNALILFEAVVLPPELLLIGPQHPDNTVIHFWSAFTSYIIHRLLVTVFFDGHLHQICWGGNFDIERIAVSSDGKVMINAPPENYTPAGGQADCTALHHIIDQYLRIPFTHGYPVHVNSLVDLLQNYDEHLWGNKNFLTFLVNSPCLLSHADKHKWYDQIDQKIVRLPQNHLKNLRALFTNPIFTGWQTYIVHVPALYNIFMHNARFDPIAQVFVSVYSDHLDQGFHLGRNFLSHPPAGVTAEQAESALSYLLDHLLAVFVRILAVDFIGPPEWNLMGIISNFNSDKSRFYA